MIALVTGGRNYWDEAHIYKVLDKLHKDYRFKGLVQGGADGADTIAKEWSHSRGVQPITFEAMWDHEDDAGTKRNQRMIDLIHVDLVIAFKGDTGTSNMMYKAYKKEIRIIDATDIQ